jgi:ssDNA-binding Zn-finger/Zn-ribbon topoisomerase 1
VKIETTVACDKCGSKMILRDSKRGPFLGCSSFPKCRNTKMMKKLEGADLAQVEALVPHLKEGAAKNVEMIAKILGQNPAAVGASRPTSPPTSTATNAASP